MDPKQDRLEREQLDPRDQFIVDDLCDYQTRLDQRAVDCPSSVEGREIPVELQPMIDKCREVLDFLHDARAATSVPARDPEHSDVATQYVPPSRIGRFKIVEQLGFGGFGVVFRGIDPIVGRQVAIKIPRPELLGAPEFIERFAREASIVAQLEHPNIVSIYESSCHDIVPYIVMSYIPGKTITQWRAEHTDAPPLMVARIGFDLAIAVAHAHERGVLHRDIKPRNIILSPRKNTASESDFVFTPILTDFGMARCVDLDASHTRTGTMIGTTGYMSPEQAEGRSRDITARTDVYGLGTVLYELLTGKPPFHSSSTPQTIQKILRDEPLPPRVCRPSIPLDLEVICLKCLEKSPSNRYQSAQALADDLQRFMNGEPIWARPISTFVRVQKWVFRHPTLASMIVASVISLMAIVEISFWYNAQLVSLLAISERDRIAARKVEHDVKRRAYQSDMRNAKINLDRGNLRQMLKLLDRYRPEEPSEDLRDLAWWYLWREFEGTSRVLGHHEDQATSVAVTRKGDLVASGGIDGVIRLWSVPDGKLLAEFFGHESGAVESVNFSPNGNRLVSAGEDGTVRVWDLASHSELFVRREHGSHVLDAVYSPCGDIIASGGDDQMVRLWNPETGEPVAVLSGHTKRVLCLAFHPTEATLATGGADATIRFWKLRELAPEERINGGTISFEKKDHAVRALAFEPNGRSLIAGFGGEETRRYSLDGPQIGQELERRSGRSNSLCFAWPQQGSLYTAQANSEIRLDDRFDRGKPLEWLRGHFRAVLSIAAPADASFIVSASQDGYVRFWPQSQSHSWINVVKDEDFLPDHESGSCSIQWRQHYLAADFQQRQLSIYRIPDRKLERTFPKNNDDDYALSSSGRLLIIYEQNGMATCYRVNDGEVLWRREFSVIPGRKRSQAIALDETEKYLVVPCENDLLIVSTASSEILHRIGPLETLGQFQFLNERGTSLTAVCTGSDGTIRFWDLQTGNLLNRHRIPSIFPGVDYSFAVSNDHRLIAVGLGGNYAAVHVYSLQNMIEVAVIPVPSQVGLIDSRARNVAFLANSKILARSNSGCSIWEIQDEMESLGFPEFGRFGSFAVSPDGQQIAIQQRGDIQFIDGAPQKGGMTSK